MGVWDVEMLGVYECEIKGGCQDLCVSHIIYQHVHMIVVLTSAVVRSTRCDRRRIDS